MKRVTSANKGAFTLVELLVVISVIAVLMAILMPVLTKARDQAKLAMCASNLHQLGLAQHLYAANNNGRFTPGDTPWDGVAGQHSSYLWTLSKVTALGYLLDGGYLPLPTGEGSVVYCPSRRAGRAPLTGWTFYDTSGIENPAWTRGFQNWKVNGLLVAGGYEYRVGMDTPYHDAYFGGQSKGMPAARVGTSSIASDVYSWGLGNITWHKKKYNVLIGDSSVHRYTDTREIFSNPDEWFGAYYRNPGSEHHQYVFAFFDRELSFKQPQGVPLPRGFEDWYKYGERPPAWH